MTTTIKPIPTRYAGCHFRSRLEARWAVFFDTLGIEWEYEPEGFELNWRLHLDYDTPLHYLPDFHLPGLGLWAEVKGSLDEGETIRLLNAAASLGEMKEGAGGCSGPSNDLVVLGSVPRTARLPVRLHMHKGDLLAAPAFRWALAGGVCDSAVLKVVGRDVGEGFLDDLAKWEDHFPGPRVIPPWKRAADFLLRGAAPPEVMVGAAMRRAYTAARGARFEHGQSGAT